MKINFFVPPEPCDPSQILSYLRGLGKTVYAATLSDGNLDIETPDNVIVTQAEVNAAPYLTPAQRNAAAVVAGFSQAQADFLFPKA